MFSVTDESIRSYNANSPLPIDMDGPMKFSARLLFVPSCPKKKIDLLRKVHFELQTRIWKGEPLGVCVVRSRGVKYFELWPDCDGKGESCLEFAGPKNNEKKFRAEDEDMIQLFNDEGSRYLIYFKSNHLVKRFAGPPGYEFKTHSLSQNGVLKYFDGKSGKERCIKEVTNPTESELKIFEPNFVLPYVSCTEDYVGRCRDPNDQCDQCVLRTLVERAALQEDPPKEDELRDAIVRVKEQFGNDCDAVRVAMRVLKDVREERQTREAKAKKLAVKQKNVERERARVAAQRLIEQRRRVDEFIANKSKEIARAACVAVVKVARDTDSEARRLNELRIEHVRALNSQAAKKRDAAVRARTNVVPNGDAVVAVEKRRARVVVKEATAPKPPVINDKKAEPGRLKADRAGLVLTTHARRFLANKTAKKLAADKYKADLELAIRLSLESSNAKTKTRHKTNTVKKPFVKKECRNGPTCRFGSRCHFSHQWTDKSSVDEFECSICMEITTEKYATNCGHVFCGTCAGKMEAEKQCYVCASSVTAVIRLFM
jgi:hypothetical protein